MPDPIPDEIVQFWTHTEDDGTVTQMELRIDVRWLVAQMGGRARANKTRRTTDMGRAIVLRIIDDPPPVESNGG